MGTPPSLIQLATGHVCQRINCTGISTGTSAAAVGGITTVVDMPLNSDPVTTRFELLIEKQELAKV